MSKKDDPPITPTSARVLFTTTAYKVSNNGKWPYEGQQSQRNIEGVSTAPEDAVRRKLSSSGLRLDERAEVTRLENDTGINPTSSK